MDTWMGVNDDPVTLHKYLYANVDPVNFIDPTGHFGMGGISIGMSGLGTLANVALASYDVFTMSTDGDGLTAKEAGLLVLMSFGGAAGSKIFKMVTKKGCNSFDGETLVATEHGLVPIIDIQIGDMVWAYNEETGEKSLQEVTHLIFGDGEKELVDITLENGEVLTATAEHPFYVNDEWVNAGDLVSGTNLLNLDGESIGIKLIHSYSEVQNVYNLTVANDHTYYVGDSEVLSHNVGVCKPISSINLKHIMSGDKHGGGHSIHGNAIKILNEVSPRLSNGVYRAKIRNPVDGIIETKTFFPDTWREAQIKTAIHAAHVLYVNKKGIASDFTEWVTINGEKVLMRVEMRGTGNALEVLTAHPIYKEF